MNITRIVTLAALFLAAPANTVLASTSTATTAQAKLESPATSTERALATADKPVPHAFAIYENAKLGAFLKPVLQLSSSIVGFSPHPSRDSGVSGRLTTLLLARFGLEGELTPGITFRSVFERDLGFPIGHGPVGTSVWEGTASLQARENYIRLERWGFSLTGGIVPDPASVDFVSANVLDLFGMDPYTRDPLLATGSNQGQGFLLRYANSGVTAGFMYTAGNPLVSSLSYSFGGQVSAIGTLYTAPLRALTNGLPSTDIQMQVFSPSVSYEHDYFDVKLALQYYLVDVDLLSATDASLSGYNLRGTAQAKLLDDMLRIFASGSFRKNQQYASVTDLTKRSDDDFGATAVGGGFDLTYGDFGFGGMYYWIETRTPAGGTTSKLTSQYVDVGATYWVWDRTVAAGLRYARSMNSTSEQNVLTQDSDSVIASLRLAL